jgi:hypothetical protein
VKLFDVVITPILLHGAAIFAPQNSSKLKILNRVKTRFMKRHFNLRTQTRSYMIYGETGTLPISAHCHIEALRYWHRLTLKSNNHPAKVIYNVLLQKFQHCGMENYCSSIHSLLTTYNLTSFWRNQDTQSKEGFKRLCRKQIEIQFWNNWMREVDSNRTGMGNTYALLVNQQNACTLPIYYRELHSIKLEKALFRLFTGNAYLLAERPFPYFEEVKHCPFCRDVDKVDDLFHLLTECNLFTDIRLEHIPWIFDKVKCRVDISSLFNSDYIRDKSHRLAIFAHKALTIRDNYRIKISCSGCDANSSSVINVDVTSISA